MTAPAVREHTKETNWVGKSIRRIEDPKFLRGKGGYIADRPLPGMLHVAMVKSPYAHARIVSIDTSDAEALPGVRAVITGARAAELCDPLPDFGPDPASHTWRVLAVDKVRYVGEGVVAVVAESRYIAEDGASLVSVDYEDLPTINDPEEASKEGSPLVHDPLGTNVAYERKFQFGDVDAAFAEADVVVEDRLHWRRSGSQPLEPVGATASFDSGTGQMTIWENSLTFTSYLFMLAGTLKVPSNKLDVIPVPAGGSFGSKLWAVKPAAIAGMCSRVVGVPVQYMEDRHDALTNNDHQGSDRIYYVELAAKNDGTLLGLRLRTIEDYGAYIQFGVGHHGNALAQVTGPYRIRAVEYELQAVLTNKNQQGAYRGFGSEVNNWMLERMVDLLARELSMDRRDIRRMNFIGPDQFPYFIPTGNVYDSGDYEPVLDTALELGRWDHWQAEKVKARDDGRYIGVGLVSCQERSVFSATEFWFWFDEPGAPVTSMPESVTLDIDALGNITATLYSCAFWGNSPETMTAQLVAEEFDVDPSSVNVVYAGSGQGLPATGPGGSRFTVMIAGAIEGASAKIKEKAFAIAAHLLEADAGDLEWVDNGIQVKGSPDARKTLGEVAIMAHLFKHSLPEEIESGLEASKVFDHPYTTMPSDDRSDLGVFYPFMGHACHVCVVEVDPDTGSVEFLDYAAVHDCGTMVNPRSLEGHMIGGTAQGIGTTLHEEFVYDDDGNFQSGTFFNYLIPTSMDVPEIKCGHHETASPYTPYGIKGGGEGGRMMAPGAIFSAIDDALEPFGIRMRVLPATPERIAAAIEEAGG
ncbi:MAG: xanthine dehydrogenase family protein molybdopterin-binding subunit [Acidimicrobiia bacterium]|nr:xanthine dehydrogenase family protein molybdopterin-binding subunit [Acidimicrobiia bacterium]